MNCLNCGDIYAADPKHDYGYCSERCELADPIDIPLDDVRAAREMLEKARKELDDARKVMAARMRRAHNYGASLAAIGEVAGVSRQRVHGLIGKVSR